MIPDCIVIDNTNTSTQKKETLGQQWLDVQNKYAGQKTQQVRETTNEMGKKYMDSLYKVIADHEHLREEYYIMEMMRPSTFLEGAIELKHVARRSRPLPEWGLAIYKVNNLHGTCEYVWGLPKQEEAAIMLENPLGWDAKIIKDICDFVEGKLV